MNLQRLDEVAFKYHGRYLTGKVIQLYPEFSAIRCADSKGLDYIMHITVPIPLADYERKKAAERVEKDREKYQDLIDAYTKFDGHSVEIAKALKINPRSIGSRIAAAKRRGFIK